MWASQAGGQQQQAPQTGCSTAFVFAGVPLLDANALLDASNAPSAPHNTARLRHVTHNCASATATTVLHSAGRTLSRRALHRRSRSRASSRTT
jgi:hypothetical protein